MFHPESMSRLLIVASKQQLEPVITELFKMNIFHIDDYIEKGDNQWEGFRIGMPLSGADVKSATLVKIRSIASAFGINKDAVSEQDRSSIKEVKRRIEQDLPAIAEESELLLNKRSKHESTVKEYEQKIEALRPFIDVPVQLELLQGYDSISFIAGNVKESVKLSVPCEIWEKQFKGGYFVIIAAKNSDVSVIEKELLDCQIQKVQIPEGVGLASQLIQEFEDEIKELKTTISDLSSQMETIRKKHEIFLLSSEEFLTGDVEQAEAPLRFATTDHTFSVTGWVPTSKMTKVYENLDKVCAGKVYITELEVEDYNDMPPVEYNNPNFSHPTELFMDLYARPRYTEVDPTLLMSILYPIMFGLILGDVGYGIILLIMSFVLLKYVKDSEAGKQLVKILRNCSISTIVFGVLFSECFGFTLPWDPLWLSRHIKIGTGASENVVTEAASHGMQATAQHVSHIPQLLVLSIWIGILHITLGRIWGALNAARMDHGEHRTLKIYSNLGWVLLMWGILFLIWSKFPIVLMPDLTHLPMVASGFNLAAVFGAFILILGLTFIARENVLDLMEVPTIISHVLSYTRLTAVGLSSVAIAMVTNFIALDMIINPQLKAISPLGIILIIVGIVVFLFGHTLNTALGILGGGIHPLRLHYVEFFTKFYRGGGKRYSPFGMIRKLTEQTD
jgi:V/A-type H+/Na+-transporting ATPase subunit I